MQETNPRISITPSDKINVGAEAHDGKKKIFWSQRCASLIVSLVLLTMGLANGWSSPYLAKLSLKESVEGIRRATDDELTYVASFLNFGRIFGAVCGAVAQDTVGRKMSLFLSGLPMLSGWICLVVAVNVQWLYAHRILCGISMGMIWTTISHYLAEIADPEIRGSLILWNLAVHGIGQFIGNTMGPYLSMKMYAYIAIAINLLFLVLFAPVPDTPYQYIMDEKLNKAEESLRWFRRSKNVKSELLELQVYVSNSKMTIKQRLIELKQPRYAKSFMLMFLINIFAYFGANNVTMAYMEIILTQSQTAVNPSTVVSVVGLCSIVSSLLATVLVDRFGRRCLLIASSLGMAISLTGLGLHFKLLSLGCDPATLSWLPCICLLVCCISYSAGCGCIPSALIGELFSPVLKSVASLCFSGTSAIFSTLSTATYLPFFNLIGPSYLFWFYASGVYASVIYYYLYLPETMGKSLQNIQKEPNNKK